MAILGVVHNLSPRHPIFLVHHFCDAIKTKRRKRKTVFI